MTAEVEITRTDWYAWRWPPPEWCHANADAPGLLWFGDGKQITEVRFHRSHLPLLPPEIVAALPTPSMEIEAQHDAAAIEQWLAHKGIKLRPHQGEALPFLLSRQHALLAYEMRLGKTLTACAAHNPNKGPLVVLGPLAARDVWRDWIERVHGFAPYVCAGKSPTDEQILEARQAPAFFVHFDVLDPWTKLFALLPKRIATLIIDEIHLLQNRKSKRANAARALSLQADRIIGLSGTPMWGRPDSMYALLDLVSPTAWGAHFPFARRYCGAMPSAHGWRYDGVSNEQEFAARLRHVMLRKTWKDAAPHLPDTIRVVEPVYVSPSQQATIEGLAINAALAKTGMTTTVAGYLAALRRRMAEVKIKPALDAAEDAFANSHPKVVVWTWHRDVQSKLVQEAHARKINVIELTADMSANQREAAVKAFHAAQVNTIMVVGIAVGGVAIDLSCSDYAIFAELDWTPANNYQAAMRTFSPSRPHCLVFLYADVPVESRLIQALQVKEGFQEVLQLGFDDIARRVLEG